MVRLLNAYIKPITQLACRHNSKYNRKGQPIHIAYGYNKNLKTFLSGVRVEEGNRLIIPDGCNKITYTAHSTISHLLATFLQCISLHPD